jgi:phospholipid/cholesterol/gamma-HCH transport system substrate-binding protein
VKRSLELARMNVRVGLMSLAGFLVLVWVLFFPVRGVSSFSSKFRVTGYFERVDGLRRNAPVYFRGTEVGSVESVKIIPERPEAPLQVVVSVEKGVQPLLPKTVRMDIVALGLLGDVFIDLQADTLRRGDEPMLADGDVLETHPYESVLAGMNGLTGQVKQTLDEVNAILAQVHSGRGTVGRLVADDELYTQLVAAIRELRQTTAKINDIQTTINVKLMDANTKKAVDQAVGSAQRVIARADEMTAKAEAIRWHLSLGMDKYEAQLYGATAALRVIPNKDRYYEGGISYFNQDLSFTANDNSLGQGYIGYNAFLAWRILDSPVFIRGGIKRSSPDVGLDWRVGEMVDWLPLEIDADAYHFGNSVSQFDLGASYAFAKALMITFGVENMAVSPQYRAGLVLLYDDEDLTSVLVKAKTGL